MISPANMAESRGGKTTTVTTNAAIDEKAMNISSPSRCYLLELPRELRHEICKLVLHQPTGVKVNLKTGCVNRKDIAITMVNKQLQRECGTLYFSLNTFIFKLKYLSDEVMQPTYEWLDEQAMFNYFVRRHVANLRAVRILFEGLYEIRQVTCYQGDAFRGNVQGLRTAFAMLERNSVKARFIIHFDWDASVYLDITPLDRVTAEREIRTQLHDAVPDSETLACYPTWRADMHRSLVEALFGRCRRFVRG